ncbi:MAG: hypothetical protein EZS28_027341 [Streblomastix strix]|uniref:Uncharacterized protein n=1 Tax=Streblomastix strix TaxID=222440 RepID=A0A5J4V402_9EUKA|nr:MAG: hypothetical protein EZS28_027341 [Streblomastix strix]
MQMQSLMQLSGLQQNYTSHVVAFIIKIELVMDSKLEQFAHRHLIFVLLVIFIETLLVSIVQCTLPFANTNSEQRLLHFYRFHQPAKQHLNFASLLAHADFIFLLLHEVILDSRECFVISHLNLAKYFSSSRKSDFQSNLVKTAGMSLLLELLCV